MGCKFSYLEEYHLRAFEERQTKGGVVNSGSSSSIPSLNGHLFLHSHKNKMTEAFSELLGHTNNRLRVSIDIMFIVLKTAL
eukprot:scaffold9342_cov163-Cylindrotheca_fusiformis.AAC.3